MGVFKDKDYKKIIDIMNPYLKICVAVNAKGERALDADTLKEEIKASQQARYGKGKCDIYSCHSVCDGMKKAVEITEKLQQTGRKTVIIAFGSLSYLSEAKKYIEES
jgi:folylpolyglutamate synthase/dihydropteroate synthase